ncbi:MAG: bacteriocin-protection protein [bacterium]|nr:bacteriocin-protection protein [bacterium]
MNVPEDFMLALKEGEMLERFEAMPPSHRKEYLDWIEQAKKPETRKNRIAKAVTMIRDKAGC